MQRVRRPGPPGCQARAERARRDPLGPVERSAVRHSRARTRPPETKWGVRHLGRTRPRRPTEARFHADELSAALSSRFCQPWGPPSDSRLIEPTGEQRRGGSCSATVQVGSTHRRPSWGRVALALISSCALFSSCGGREFDITPMPDAPPACAAASSACDLPGGAPPQDACTTCVDDAICQCKDLNWDTWGVPTDCETGGSACTRDDVPTKTQACKVAAVEMVRCMLGKTHAACASSYFGSEPNPALIDPIGMDFGLYGCAVCTTCAGPCAAAPELNTMCAAIPGRGK
jgi:hypothetical protein